MLSAFGDLVGLPLLPPYYSLRLLPYIVSSIEKWKRRLLREKDLTDFIAADISCYYLGMNLGNILIIGYTDQGYCQKSPWDCVLPNKIQSQEGKLSENRMLPLLWPE